MDYGYLGPFSVVVALGALVYAGIRVHASIQRKKDSK